MDGSGKEWKRIGRTDIYISKAKKNEMEWFELGENNIGMKAKIFPRTKNQPLWWLMRTLEILGLTMKFFIFDAIEEA